MTSEGTQPRLSFGIPYFQGRDLLREAILSVLDQSVTDWEMVIVDDAGPEPAADIVEEIADPRIKYVRNQTNLGLAANWNECVHRTRAPFVTLLHADDRLRSDYAQHVLEALDSHPDVAAAFSDAHVINSNGDRHITLADAVKAFLPRRSADHLLKGDADLAGLVRGNYIVCPTLCMRRALVGTKPFDESLRFVPDWDFTTRVLASGGSLWAIRRPLLDYRRHDDSQTSILTAATLRFEEEIAFLRRLEGEASRLGLHRTAVQARRRVTVRGHLLIHALLASARRDRSARDKWRLLLSDLGS